MKQLRIILLILVANSVFAQTKSDLDLLLNKEFTDTTFVTTHKTFYVFKGRNAFVKYNPVSLLFGGGLLFYQSVISKQLMQGCAFEPSCSNFSKQCIKEFGLVKGISLSTDRLTRCTRLSAIDFHPIMFTESGKVKDLPAYYRLH